MNITKIKMVEQLIFNDRVFKVGRPYRLLLTVHNNQDVGNDKMYELFAILNHFSEQTISFVTSYDTHDTTAIDALIKVGVSHRLSDSGSVSFNISSESSLLKYDSLDKIDIRPIEV